MDIERSCIEILFRYITAEDIDGRSCSYDRIEKQLFLNAASEWMRNYTGDEVLQIYEWLKQELSSGKNGIYSYIRRLAEQFLEMGAGRIHLRMKDEAGVFQLLRWRELTVSLGEDIFCASYLAGRKSLKRRSLLACMTSVFTGFDYDSLCGLFGKTSGRTFIPNDGLAENHFHLKGSMPVFLLNWVCLMNQIGARKDFFRQFTDYLTPQTIFTDQSLTRNDLAWLCQRAAYYRFYLWNRIKKNNWLLRNQMFQAPEYFREMDLPKLQRYIDVSLMRRDGCLDYAAADIWEECRDRPGRAIAGERYFLYRCFVCIEEGNFSGQDKNLFYRYLVIALRVRSEIVQANRRIGFRNFASYQDRKEDFIWHFQAYKDEMIRLAVNATKEYQNISTMELRITPKDTAMETLGQIAEYDRQMAPVRPEEAFYVLHFPKKPEEAFCLGEPRNYRVRRKLDVQKAAMAEIMRGEYVNCLYKKSAPRVRGFDACSGEVGCRPEVFAQTFRWLKCHAPQELPTHFTYHAGEDFLDLTDGIRAVEETIRFLELPPGSRIGHGMAIALDADAYYKLKHGTLALRRQDMLDNICWVLGTCEEWEIEMAGGLRDALIRKAEELIRIIYRVEQKENLSGKEKGETVKRDEKPDGKEGEKIKRGKREAAASTFRSFCLHPEEPLWREYYQAWKLRGDRPGLYLMPEKEFEAYPASIMQREECAVILDDKLAEIRKNPQCRSYYRQYHFDRRVRAEGNKREIFHVDDLYIKVIGQIQEALRMRMEQKQIYVEGNPSSNYMIGPFERYEQHPMLRMYGKGLEDHPSSGLCVSINTDDQGVFQTSLELEYAIMYTALCKSRDENGVKRYTERQVLKWLMEIKWFGRKQVF